MLRTLPYVALALYAAGGAAALAQDDIPPAPALFLAPDISTAGAAVAVGPDGTLHMAAASYNHGADGGAVVYATCLADCGEDASWRRTELPVAGVDRAHIAVTPGGAPRLLITADAADGSGGLDYLYAACGGGLFGAAAGSCLEPGRWSIARIATSLEDPISGFLEATLPQRVFALDPAGNPRFVYTDANYVTEPDHYGAFYMSCDSGCTDARNWAETNLAYHLEYRTEDFSQPVLAIGPSGSAHLLARVYGFELDGSDIPADLYYYECRADCTERANWSRVSVIDPGGGSYPSPTWDLAVDAEGRPRAAIFIGSGAELEGIDHALIYGWCDTDCTSDAGWAGSMIFDGSYGESPALAIDRAGNPWVAFLSPEALPVVATCREGCASEAGVWNGHVFEADSDMAADRPTALPFTCDAELWNAQNPDLALGPDGAPYVAYDVAVEARCLYQEFGEPQITYEFHEIWHGARVAAPTMP